MAITKNGFRETHETGFLVMGVSINPVSETRVLLETPFTEMPIWIITVTENYSYLEMVVSRNPRNPHFHDMISETGGFCQPQLLKCQLRQL